MSLKEKMTKLNSNEGIPFMNDRTKGDIQEIIGTVVTIKNYDFLNGDAGQYVVFIVEEIKDSFFFGGTVLTNTLKALDVDDKKEVQESGLPVRLFECENKKGRKYINAEFYPV